jgi:hypothetical protein
MYTLQGKARTTRHTPSTLDLRMVSDHISHVVGAFNTCSRGLTHQSLTDTGGRYNLGGAGLSHITPRPFHPAISIFHLRALLNLYFNHELLNQSFDFKDPMVATWSFDHSAIYRILYLCIAIANDLSLAIGSTRISCKVIVMQLGTNSTLIT